MSRFKQQFNNASSPVKDVKTDDRFKDTLFKNSVKVVLTEVFGATEPTYKDFRHMDQYNIDWVAMAWRHRHAHLSRSERGNLLFKQWKQLNIGKLDAWEFERFDAR